MKAGVAHFTTSLAAMAGRRGIRVNAIGPDLTQTPQVDYITGFEEAEELWPSWAPIGRLGWPEDQARVALFLASDMSSYVTGHNVPVDGGTKAGGGWFFSPSERRFVNRPKTL
jgi:NAD(P)-dependent dehydrogenase (short-subunit alcohol dehydrogenase family)